MTSLIYSKAKNNSSFKQGKDAETEVHRKIKSLTDDHKFKNAKAVFNSRKADS